MTKTEIQSPSLPESLDGVAFGSKPVSLTGTAAAVFLLHLVFPSLQVWLANSLTQNAQFLAPSLWEAFSTCPSYTLML